MKNFLTLSLFLLSINAVAKPNINCLISTWQVGTNANSFNDLTIEVNNDEQFYASGSFKSNLGWVSGNPSKNEYSLYLLDKRIAQQLKSQGSFNDAGFLSLELQDNDTRTSIECTKK